MHLKRWLTSIVALPILFVLILKGGRISFAILIAIAALGALWEYFRMVLPEGGKIIERFATYPSLLVGPFIVWAVYCRSWYTLTGLLVLLLICLAVFAIWRFEGSPIIFDEAARHITGIIYIPLFLSFLVALRNSPSGVSWIFLLLAIVFAGDTAAFYTGSFLGRHKICPAVSPNKTLEGSIGGLVANVAVGALIKFIFFAEISWGVGIVLFIWIGIAAQLGDLFESVIKRSVGVKDSGVILPGHGGILDRIDALIFAAPATYFFKEFFL